MWLWLQPGFRPVLPALWGEGRNQTKSYLDYSTRLESTQLIQKLLIISLPIKIAPFWSINCLQTSPYIILMENITHKHHVLPRLTLRMSRLSNMIGEIAGNTVYTRCSLVWDSKFSGFVALRRCLSTLKDNA